MTGSLLNYILRAVFVLSELRKASVEEVIFGTGSSVRVARIGREFLEAGWVG